MFGNRTHLVQKKRQVMEMIALLCCLSALTVVGGVI